jgi:hypothetical protein
MLYRTGRYRPPVPVRDDVEVLRQGLPQGGVESRSGELGGPHEEALRAFDVSVAYVVLDNLKQGVIKPDLYAGVESGVCSAAGALLSRRGRPGAQSRT